MPLTHLIQADIDYLKDNLEDPLQVLIELKEDIEKRKKEIDKFFIDHEEEKKSKYPDAIRKKNKLTKLLGDVEQQIADIKKYVNAGNTVDGGLDDIECNKIEVHNKKEAIERENEKGLISEWEAIGEISKKLNSIMPESQPYNPTPYNYELEGKPTSNATIVQSYIRAGMQTKGYEIKDYQYAQHGHIHVVSINKKVAFQVDDTNGSVRITNSKYQDEAARVFAMSVKPDQKVCVVSSLRPSTTASRVNALIRAGVDPDQIHVKSRFLGRKGKEPYKPSESHKKDYDAAKAEGKDLLAAHQSRAEIMKKEKTAVDRKAIEKLPYIPGKK